MLITYLRFQSTERFFSGAGEGGREGVQMPAINECHLLHRGRAEPMVAKAVRAKITVICTQESSEAKHVERDGHQAAKERSPPPGKINANDL